MGYFPPVSPGLTLVADQVIAGAAATDFTFAGLSGDADGIYELWWSMKALTGAATRIFLLPNALTTNQLSTVSRTAGTPASPTSNISVARLTAAHGMQRSDGWGRLVFWAKTATFRALTAHAGDGALSAGGNYDRVYAQGMWRDSAINVTSLVLQTATVLNVPTAGWGIGSAAQLWKRPY